jgi:hypothetical protein
MKIEVTKKDIKKGKRRHNGRNPVSLALSRIFKAKGGVTVVDEFILVDKTGEGQCASWTTPKRVIKFLDEFDAVGKKAKPFEFKLPKRKFGTLHLADDEDEIVFVRGGK